MTHRDPNTLLASLTSLIANLRWAHSDEVDAAAIATAHRERYAASFDRLVDWSEAGRLPEERMHHSHFADFQTNAMAVVRRLYERFGLAWNPEAEAAMRQALEANPSDRLGGHRYARETERVDDFDRYRRYFDVPVDTA